MLNGKKVLAIIPARGESKGIPRKNIKILAGKPLIAYSIEQAKKCPFVDRIIVSTEDKEIAEVSEKYGAEVIIRPEELARDDSPSLPVFHQVIQTLEKRGDNYELIVILQPTHPFRKVEHINKTLEKLEEGFDSATTVSPLNIHPCRFLKIDHEKSIFLNDDKNTLRQNIDQFHVNGAVYSYKKDVLMSLKELGWQKTNNAAIEIDEKYAFDIDEPLDFEIAEYLMEKKINEEKRIIIGDKIIGENKPVFIIAEAGVNHNGSLEIAKKLIDVASDAEADAIKFQTFKAENLVIREAKQAEYQTKNIGKEESHFDMLKRLELPFEYHQDLKQYAEEKGLIFMSTPFDDRSIDFLDDLGVKVFKAGSGETNNLPYLRRMAKKNKPMIVSTGMSTLEDSKKALNTIYSEGNKKVVLLHCTTNYPCPIDEVNLNAMQTMKNELDCLVGYSDHTEGILVPIIATSMGACVIEKHFTLDKYMEGPDHKISLEPGELKEMVEKIRLVERIKGNSEKELTKAEKELFEVARKSIVSLRDIPAGKTIDEGDIGIKRPGTGIEPKYLKLVIGRRAKENIKRDKIITMEMIV